MMPLGVSLKFSRTSSMSRDSGTLPLPNVSTRTLTGCAQLVVANLIGVLARDDDRVHADRLSFGRILHRHLGLAVRAQVGKLAVSTHLAQLFAQLVRK